jgi:ABC-type multidrug transport system fused ATPase/permease subunit
MKDGYNTLLGRQFKNGVELSIGQWQNIALACAFLGEAQILVLDEPTRSPDHSAEEHVFFKDLGK